jgi:YfiH family protein
LKRGDEKKEIRERVAVVEQNVSYLSFWPWRHDLHQGLTLRYLHGEAGIEFDLRDRGSFGSRDASENWNLFSETIGKGSDVIVEMEQVHGKVVKSVNSADKDKYQIGDKWFKLEGCDGLISNDSCVLLTARVADCVPVYLYDKTRGAIGLIHAGWRGTVAGIVQTGIQQMREEYGVSSYDITVYMGPSIEKSCFPVEHDVYKQFARWMDSDRSSADDGKVDLRETIKRQALEMGVPANRIFASGFCTSCSSDLFYSHRASSGCCGRMAAFLGFRK